MCAASRPEAVRYWRGNSSTHPSTFMSGRLLYDEDTGNVFLQYRDLTTGEEITRQLTDTQKFNIAGGVFTGPVILALQPDEVESYIDENSLSWSKELIPVTKKYADNIASTVTKHITNNDIHITPDERSSWNNKVDKKDGYNLSQNDFTNELKTKLDNISEQATKTQYEVLQTEGIRIGIITIDNQQYDIFVPEVHDIDGNSQTTTKLRTKRSINGIVFDGTKNITAFGSCKISEDPDDAQKWILDLPDFDDNLVTGSIVVIRFEEDNLSDNPTLKINDTAEAPILYDGSPIDKSFIKKDSLYCFIYDGANYNILSSPTSEQSKQNAKGIESLNKLLDSLKTQINDNKTKLDTIDTGANNYTLPTAIKYTPGGSSSENRLGGVVIGDGISVDATGQIYISRQTILDILGIPEGENILSSGALSPDTINNLLSVFTGATDSIFDDKTGEVTTSGSNGTQGLVPAPIDGQSTYLLCGNGTWTDIDTILSNSNISVSDMEGATTTSDGASGSVPQPLAGDNVKFLKGDATWEEISPIPASKIEEICI